MPRRRPQQLMALAIKEILNATQLVWLTGEQLMALTKTPIELSSTPSIVDGGNATAITIDSSENVLVGKTDTSIGVAGSEVYF